MMHLTKMFEHLKISLDAIKLATENFADTNCIGGGGFGKVYKGELLLSNIRFCDEGGEKILIYEYASKGSLDSYLNNNDLKWIQRLKICIGAARGLAYLHDPGVTHQRVLHRDIKSSNILLDENWNARIADFGLSKFGPANQQYTFLVSNTVGTIGYCDPLYVETGLLTKESDIYSFGVVLFEVLCGRLSIGNSNDKRRPLTGLVRQYYEEDKINEIIHADLKDEITPLSLQKFASIAYQCLRRDLKERPPMSEVVSKLERALEYQENVTEHLANSSPYTTNHANGLPYTQSAVSMDSDDGISYKAIGGTAGQLFDQNAQAFNQISANFTAFKVHENISLFCQAQNNIVYILNDLNDMPEMPPLPVKLNEELTNSMLPQSSLAKNA